MGTKKLYIHKFVFSHTTLIYIILFVFSSIGLKILYLLPLVRFPNNEPFFRKTDT